MNQKVHQQLFEGGPFDQTYQRNWDGKSWQRRAHLLVQLRHGAQNVQIVPDRVGGDAGLEFFTTDGCLYQCYAPEEPGNTAKASSAMKQKATRDLPKLRDKQQVIGAILAELKCNRWILFCPFLDDKAVIAHVRAKGTEIRELGLPFLSNDFEALVQSQEDFANEIAQLRRLPIGPELVILPTTDEAVDSKDKELVQTLDEKLGRAFPKASEARRIGFREIYIRNHIRRENTLETLKTDHPVLWERAWQTINAEENRLELLGAAGTAAPSEHLRESLARIEVGLAKDLPSVAHATISDLSAGTLSDWLMRCPLDFDSEP
ncbi:hypothetical protein SRABI05_04273 [Agrobacterium fabrum]|uniref:hypothetical protein n=1 Tax=Agrobacterium fabrum TaxID=1176649 RepID=UPI001DBEAE91|nr:hypothetical protein [Agrobacterium fabrum]CAH0283676.1 hypothetical protein SRABI46_04114 [Agrobacterium fabrum]CAH0297186.1 hypothetical protein SRABI05_04273 [Agrobacterium fabrum]